MKTKTKPTKRPKPTPKTQPSVPPTDIMTLDEAAAYLRVTTAALLPLAEAGAIPARFIGSEWRFSQQAILTWLSEPAPPTAAPKKGSPAAVLRTAGLFKDEGDLDEFMAILNANRKECE